MIYLIRVAETNMYKIGYTKIAAKYRLDVLQIGCPYKLSIVKD